MGQIDWIMYLSAATLYAVSSVVYIYCLVFNNERRIYLAINTALAGLVFHSVSIALRWLEAGHGPYVSMFEVLSSYAWVSIAVFLIIQQRYEKIRIGGAVVMPVSFLTMGAGSFYSRDLQMLPPSLRSYWLIAHVGFAKLAFGSILIAVSIAVLYILKDRHLKKVEAGSVNQDSLYDRLPELKVMDDLMYRFVALGFLFLTIMIGAGSIWANQTWGRYWGWDPTETWSLVSWLVHGIYLHLRLSVKWSGRRMAWFIIFSIFVLAFSAFGVGYVYSGLHTDYLTS